MKVAGDPAKPGVSAYERCFRLLMYANPQSPIEQRYLGLLLRVFQTRADRVDLYKWLVDRFRERDAADAGANGPDGVAGEGSTAPESVPPMGCGDGRVDAPSVGQEG